MPVRLDASPPLVCIVWPFLERDPVPRAYIPHLLEAEPIFSGRVYIGIVEERMDGESLREMREHVAGA